MASSNVKDGSFQPAILVVGAGPTGLAAALLLAQRGISVRIIDPVLQPTPYSKALAVNVRTLEVLRETGVADRIVAEGWAAAGATVHLHDRAVATVDLSSSLGTPRAMTILPQARTEALLAEALQAQGVNVERGVSLLTLEQNESRVLSTLAQADGRTEQVQTSLVFGADGARSATRHALGLGFDGSSLPEPWRLWDMQLETKLDRMQAHIILEPDGFIFMLRLHGDQWRVIGNGADTLASLGRYSKLGTIAWQSEFHIGHRVATQAAVGRVALGGDAAHIHSPIGARGMNLGIEDAYVYADCAAGALAGNMSRLQDYAELRHAVHKQVVRRISVMTHFARGRPAWLRVVRDAVMPVAARFAPVRRQMLKTIGGLDHPLVIRR
jgi:3-(3-hydroxy-phenyl)propionate hydroxylase